MNNVNETIISQYANSPKILQLIADMNEAIENCADFQKFYDDVWNIETAVTFGLDIWGKILGVDRNIYIPPLFPVRTSAVYTMTDTEYRKMLLTKALANITPATAEGINVILKLIYSEQDNAFSVDLGGMDMQYKMLYRPEDWQYGIMLAGNIVPKPAAVGAGTFTINEYFGFSEAISWQPFDIAIFADY
jgi:hypothetical protein